MRKHRKSRKHKARRRNPGLSSLAWVVNSGKRKGKKRRKGGGRKRSRARRAAMRTRTIVIRAGNPGKSRRRARRANPSHALMLGGRRTRAHHRRRRNPGFGSSAKGVLASVFAPFKEYGIGTASTALIDLFVADPLTARLAPAFQGPAKLLGYPLVMGILGRFFKGPKTSKLLGQIAVFGFGYGVKDTISNLLGTPQAQLKGLADGYASRVAQMTRQQNAGGMRYIPSAQGMRFIPSPQQMRGIGGGMGYIPAAQSANSANRRY